MAERIEIAWSEMYRPSSLDDIVLPTHTRKLLSSMVEKEKLQNLLFSGVCGTGKTTTAVAMLKTLQSDSVIINGSLRGNIDTLRNEIQAFASTVSLYRKRKYVILDEADYLSAATQAALRNFMEEFSKNCGFILTCNYPNKIIDALRSRCTEVDFSSNHTERADIAKGYWKILNDILLKEGYTYEDKEILFMLIKRNFPDLRKTINDLQALATTSDTNDKFITKEMFGKTFEENSVEDVFKHLKSKNFEDCRKWVANHVTAGKRKQRVYRNVKSYGKIREKDKPASGNCFARGLPV